MATTAITSYIAPKIIPLNGSMSVIYIKSAQYSQERPNLAAYKRGTGGRCSFNGVVATVFGCTGFVGRYVCNKLGKMGSQMVLPYRSDYYDAIRLKVAGDLGQVVFTPYDIRDEESIAKAVKYSNVVINLVGREYETKNFKFKDVNVDGPRRIARISREMGVERFIHLSYLNQEANPKPLVMSNPKWKISKFLGECAVKEEFPTATIITASDIYGSEDRFLRTFGSNWRLGQGKKVPLYKNGLETLKAPVFVSDVAQGIINAMRNPETQCQIYQAYGPKQYLLSDLCDWFFALMRKDEGWGYKRHDMNSDWLFKLKIKLNSIISPSYPFGNLHWEALEKESTSDQINPTAPSLLDLGVTLTHMEDQAPWELKPYRAYQYYIDQIGEFPAPRPPPPTSMPSRNL